jgi:sRNA-binding regulator protein Hfq
MKPEKNDYVKIFLKNGMQLEGNVASWGKEIILSSGDNVNFMVIKKPKQIVMYKIEKQHSFKKENTNPTTAAQSPSQEIYQLDSNTYLEDESTDDHESLNKSLELKGKSLAQLHKIKIQQEKEAIANKLKDHQISGPQKVNYELPGFFTKQSSK